VKQKHTELYTRLREEFDPDSKKRHRTMDAAKVAQQIVGDAEEAGELECLRWCLKEVGTGETAPKTKCPGDADQRVFWTAYLRHLQALDSEERNKTWGEYMKVVLKRAEEKESRYSDDGRDVLELIPDTAAQSELRRTAHWTKWRCSGG